MSETNSHIILHVDLDCFFAAVEQRDNPELRGLPVIIGADPKKGFGRGVISTCSYEARVYGLHSAMPISRAYELCPHGIYVRGSFKKYGEASKQVMSILRKHACIFMQGGCDEAYLEVTDKCRNYYDAKIIADQIRKEVQENVGITCSVGIGPTKTIAKIASDYNKPNGVTVVEPDCIKTFLKNMDITKIPGIGKKSRIYYEKKGIIKIGDFYKLRTKKKLYQKFNKNGLWIWNIINGIGNGIVIDYGMRKSIGKERTFMQDVNDPKQIFDRLNELNKRLHKEIREERIFYKTVTLKVRFRGFETYTRSISFSHPIRDENKTIEAVMNLFQKFNGEKKKIRLVGIRFTNLEKEKKKNTKKQLCITQFLAPNEHNYSNNWNQNEKCIIGTN